MYEPQVDDYVIWKRPNGDIEEGWVYFKCPPMEKKKGFPDPTEYITIEVGVKPRPQCKYSKNYKHKNIHTLLLCYKHDWHELKYVKHRRSREIHHYSQYDDVNQEEKLVEKYKSVTGMYKSQEGRLPDY